MSDIDELVRKLRTELADDKEICDDTDTPLDAFDRGVRAGRYELADELLSGLVDRCPLCSRPVMSVPPNARPSNAVGSEHQDCTFPNRGARWVV